MSIITPILLCGGSGTRLWPLSRQSRPKQFADIVGELTLFQAGATRLSGPRFAPPVVVIANDFRFVVERQLEEVGITPQNVLIEPEARNTAPAVLAAAMVAYANDPKAMLLIAPSDHLIPDSQKFKETLAPAVDAANAGRLVTFGIKPTHPETAYGYLELGPDAGEQHGASPLLRFVEKPDIALAREMCEQGNYLWNAGIFLFTAEEIIAAYHQHAPGLVPPVQNAVAQAQSDLNFCRLDADSWALAEDISIDYAVMEKADNLSVVPYHGKWSDLGGWDAVWREAKQEQSVDGVVTRGRATQIDCTDSLLRSESDEIEIVGIGLKNIVAVAMSDAVLVADMGQAQSVKKAVATLKVKKAHQATTFPKKHRPWGWFENIAAGEGFRVNRVHVNANASLSLRSHTYRSQHWIVVQGAVELTTSTKTTHLEENESVYIPPQVVHRLANNGSGPAVLIETQTGKRLDEDDVVRFGETADFSNSVAEA